ncbi:MAG: CBS domain-containing protein [Cyanobacteria bacterium J06598_3]
MTAQPSLAVTPSLASAINPCVIKVLPDTSVAEIIRRMSDMEGETCAAVENDLAVSTVDWTPVLVNAVPATEAVVPALDCSAPNQASANQASPNQISEERASEERASEERASGERPSGEGGSKRRDSCAIVVAPDPKDPSSPHQVIGILTERDIVRLTATQAYDSQKLETIPVSAVMTTPVKTLEDSAFQDIFAVLFLFRRYRIRHLPIVDSANQLIGVVTPASIRQVLRPANLLKMRRVGDVMSKDVVQAPMSVSVMFLAQVMAEKRVSCVVIVDTSIVGETGEPEPCPPVGIVTERDIVQFQSLGLDLNKVTAETVMSQPLHLLDPQDSLWAAHEAMKTRRVRRLVVSWNWGKGLGIVTQTSLLRVFDPIGMYGIIDSLQNTIKQIKAETDEVPRAGAVPPLSEGEQGRKEAGIKEAGRKEAGKSVKLLTGKVTPQIELASPNLNEPQNLIALLTEATNCIAAVRQPGLATLQQQQLTKANQLIQRVRAELMLEPE